MTTEDFLFILMFIAVYTMGNIIKFINEKKNRWLQNILMDKMQ